MKKQLLPLPSTQEIAEKAGVTKGVIYHYFETKEEIFLTLLRREIQKLMDAISEILDGPEYSAEAMRDCFVKCCQNDILMYLGSIGPSILEANISSDFTLGFKEFNFVGTDELAKRWHRAEPGISLEDLRKFLVRMYFSALTQWQYYHPPKAVSEAFSKSPDDPRTTNWLSLFEGDFATSLRECYDWLWHGMHATAAPKKERLGSRSRR
ncbi:TetR family transcriptional regulator [Granulicella sp. dw_53]|uniref:TetR family transcriptional regulator n=1 Tax=Granulicella sp. dw_53 TaxID=2719792 RepID=UPI001BD48993|nr:TetR family transcriptional regulator [Granulicella sp. dw_53]